MLPFIDRRVSLRNDPAFILALVICCGFFSLSTLVLLKEIPKDSQSIAQQIISIAGMLMSAMAGYFYGASKATAETDKKQVTTTTVTDSPKVTVQTSGETSKGVVEMQSNQEKDQQRDNGRQDPAPGKTPPNPPQPGNNQPDKNPGDGKGNDKD